MSHNRLCSSVHSGGYFRRYLSFHFNFDPITFVWEDTLNLFHSVYEWNSCEHQSNQYKYICWALNRLWDPPRNNPCGYSNSSTIDIQNYRPALKNTYWSWTDKIKPKMDILVVFTLWNRKNKNTSHGLFLWAHPWWNKFVPRSADGGLSWKALRGICMPLALNASFRTSCLDPLVPQSVFFISHFSAFPRVWLFICSGVCALPSVENRTLH